MMRSFRKLRELAVLVCCAAVFAVPVCLRAQGPTSAKAVGTIKAIDGRTITLSADAGGETTVLLQDGARLLRVEPGQKDLKEAVALDLRDLQPGDRVLVRGKMAEDNKSVIAVSLIAMKKLDIAQKQAREREEWQKHGVGGLVSGVDLSTATITIATTAMGTNKTVAVHISGDTVLRRYAPASVKFDDAKVAPISEIKVGDQLRARGTRSANGGELSADEVVSGSFRNIAGTISSIDSSAGAITVFDLAAKRPVVVKVTSESQVRKLPGDMAQRIAARLKGSLSEAGPAGVSQRNGEASTQRNVSEGSPGGRGDSQQGSGDLQQAVSRIAPSSLGDLSKGDVVMIVATSGTPEGEPTAITILAGVEAILQASPKAQSILSPWTLSSGGEAATP